MVNIKVLQQWSYRVTILLLLFMAMAMQSCVSYLYQAARGQWEILSDNVPIDTVIADPAKYGVTPDELVKLRDVQGIHHFAEYNLGLTAKKSYTKFKRLKQKYPVFLVTASEELAWKPVTWYFPIAGRVAYIGFFSREDQERKARELQAKGYDVRRQNVIAYSTLGWFEDPLLSSMLLLPRSLFINTLIHEMAHATIYFPGDTSFNESVATFLGDEGSQMYIQDKVKDNAALLTYIEKVRHDQSLFIQHIQPLIARLKALYQSDQQPDQKRLLKKKWIRENQDHFAKLKKRLKADRFDFYFHKDFKPNNAYYQNFQRYFLDLDLFYEGYHLFGRDYTRYLAFLKELANKGEKPYKQLLRHQLDLIKAQRLEQRKNYSNGSR